MKCLTYQIFHKRLLYKSVLNEKSFQLIFESDTTSYRQNCVTGAAILQVEIHEIYLNVINKYAMK